MKYKESEEQPTVVIETIETKCEPKEVCPKADDSLSSSLMKIISLRLEIIKESTRVIEDCLSQYKALYDKDDC
jgi:hypothetical protein